MTTKQRDYIASFLRETAEIAGKLDQEQIFKTGEILAMVRENGGRLFLIGVGGGAGNASHAANDFRKIAGIESYAITDNVSELTARINDDGWESAYAMMLKGSNLNGEDAILVFSVGGGNVEKNVSVNIVNAIRYAQEVDAWILGVVGRDGGYTAQVADACVIVPPLNPSTVTPQTEGFQGIIWHALVSSPDLLRNEMKWERTK